jgi:phospholipid/cholesterol/gamma-HCH transport system permease protein
LAGASLLTRRAGPAAGHASGEPEPQPGATVEREQIERGAVSLVAKFLLDTAAAGALAQACVRALRYPRVYLPLTFAQIRDIGVGSIPLVVLVAAISGAVTSEQSGFQFSPGTMPASIVGRVITSSVLTELGPVVTALVLVGRVGARIGSELATMVVTDQVYALRATGRDPALYLALPRILAGVLAVPALVIIADATGMLAGLGLALIRMPVTVADFAAGARSYFFPFVLWFSLIKGAAFGLCITFIGCLVGLRASGGAAGVGRATTASVVASTIGVMVGDLVLVRLLGVFH